MMVICSYFNNRKIITNMSKLFEYKAIIIGRTPGDNNLLSTEVLVPLKYLSNFSKFLNLYSINCLTWLVMVTKMYNI